jgi:hypothetical protein
MYVIKTRIYKYYYNHQSSFRSAAIVPCTLARASNTEQSEFFEKHNPVFFQLANVKKKPYKHPRLPYRTGGSFLVKKIYREYNW